MAEKSFFRGAWRHRRCLIPADGFYEWSVAGDGASTRSPKQPWWIGRRDRQPFWLGGIWDRWIGADGSEVESCCVLTTAPNGLMRPIHDRMPVVLPDGLEEAWLDAGRWAGAAGPRTADGALGSRRDGRRCSWGHAGVGIDQVPGSRRQRLSQGSRH